MSNYPPFPSNGKCYFKPFFICGILSFKEPLISKQSFLTLAAIKIISPQLKQKSIESSTALYSIYYFVNPL